MTMTNSDIVLVNQDYFDIFRNSDRVDALLASWRTIPTYGSRFARYVNWFFRQHEGPKQVGTTKSHSFALYMSYTNYKIYLYCRVMVQWLFAEYKKFLCKEIWSQRKNAHKGAITIRNRSPKWQHLVHGISARNKPLGLVKSFVLPNNKKSTGSDSCVAASINIAVLDAIVFLRKMPIIHIHSWCRFFE